MIFDLLYVLVAQWECQRFAFHEDAVVVVFNNGDSGNRAVTVIAAAAVGKLGACAVFSRTGVGREELFDGMSGIVGGG